MKFVRLLIGILLLFSPISVAYTQPAALSWPNAVAEVTSWRTIATACVASLKQYGNEADLASGRIAYAKAKADSDAIIAGLITAISQGNAPASLSDLHARVERSASALGDFCKMTEKLVPSTSLHRSFLSEALNAIAKPAIDKLSAAVTALYENYRTDTALMRETIRTQLEAARWPDFA